MIVVHVELWPNGDPRRKRQLGTMTIVNETDLAPHSGYEVHVDGEPLGGRLVYHWRHESVWLLVHRALHRWAGKARP